MQVGVEGAVLVGGALFGAVAADGGAAKLAGHDGRARVVWFCAQVGNKVGVHIAAQHHGARHLALRHGAQQAFTGGGIAVPAVGPVAAIRVRQGPKRRARVGCHQGLLGQQVPGSIQAPALSQPGFLRRAQHRALRVLQLGASAGTHDVGAAPKGLGASLRAAVLAVVQQVNTCQAAPVQAAVHAHVVR